MRKRLRKKLRSCALCKPHKMGIARRWSARELEGIVRAEREIRLARGPLHESREAGR